MAVEASDDQYCHFHKIGPVINEIGELLGWDAQHREEDDEEITADCADGGVEVHDSVAFVVNADESVTFAELAPRSTGFMTHFDRC